MVGCFSQDIFLLHSYADLPFCPGELLPGASPFVGRGDRTLFSPFFPPFPEADPFTVSKGGYADAWMMRMEGERSAFSLPLLKGEKEKLRGRWGLSQKTLLLYLVPIFAELHYHLKTPSRKGAEDP